MYRLRLFRKYPLIIAGVLAPIDPKENDIYTKDTKTYKSFLELKPANETGFDRIKQMFQVDEFGTLSQELNSIYQTGFLGFLTGVLYGGFTHSKEAYMKFMETNQATAFKSHLDAKQKLQDQFTINFAKGAFKWGWRVGLFTTSYFGIITMVSVYREKSSIYEYLLAGALTGGIYKANLGLRGICAGAIFGGTFGGIAGAVSLLILYASGTSMEEVRFWQYKWKTKRDHLINEAIKEGMDQIPINEQHDAKVGNKITLDDIK